MPMTLLAVLSQARFPRSFVNSNDIAKIRVLAAHGHIEARIPPRRVNFPQQPVTVYAVTAQGRRALDVAA